MRPAVRMAHGGVHGVVVFLVALVAAGQLMRCFQRLPVHTEKPGGDAFVLFGRFDDSVR